MDNKGDNNMKTTTNIFDELEVYDNISVKMPFKDTSNMYIVVAKNEDSIFLVGAQDKSYSWKVSKKYLNENKEMFEKVENI